MAEQTTFDVEKLEPVDHSMRFRVIRVTPEMAQELLKNNHPNNRRPKWGKIQQYANDMASGLWKLTHQGIAIDKDGWLVDGQNRLQAVLDSGKSVPMLVVTGVQTRSMVATDCNATRSAPDAARVAGKPFGKNEGSRASTIKFMMGGMLKTSLRPTHQEIIAFSEKHKKALDFCFECMPTMIRGVTASPLRAVVARAWYRRNSRNRLRDFCTVLTTGIMTDMEADTAAVRLRNWLLTMVNIGGERAKIYAKSEDALAAFFEGRQYDRLGQAKTEIFPIPDDPSLEDQED